MLPESQRSLEGVCIAAFVEAEFEDLELLYPVMRFQEEGATVTLIGTGSAETYRGKHGLTVTVDTSVDHVDASDYTAVIVPGGWAPDKLRRSPGVLQFMRDFNGAGKTIGMVCHAGWVGISAGIVRGRRMTGTTAIKDDVNNAGAEWVDTPAIRDGHFVTGRVVADIPAWTKLLVATVYEQVGDRQPVAAD